MNDPEPLSGLTCPKCGGVVTVPEGQVIVRCPYCDLRSLVHGERGHLGYQVRQQVSREKAVEMLHGFLSGNMAIAMNAASKAVLSEAFLVHLPFWTSWGRVAAWAFGQKKVGSGDHTRYDPREVRIVQDMNWNGAACDVGEFGVSRVPLVEQALEPLKLEDLHASGMVFEPVGLSNEARSASQAQFRQQVQDTADLDRLAQLFQRVFRRRFGVVYYPLWVLRYLYRGRVFQVVVDGHSGKVLYGKAPGNSLYRALMLVAGMAVGAFLAVDIPAFILRLTTDDTAFVFALLSLVGGFALMGGAYRKFRYGEQYEYRANPVRVGDGDTFASMITSVKDIEKWVKELS